MPGIPRQSLKLRVDVEAVTDWNIGLNLLGASGVYARGDENNLDVNGRVGGYAVVNLDTRYQVTRGLSLFARVDNLFDRRYASFAILGRNVFTGSGQSFDGTNSRPEQFRGHGAPRGAWLGMQYAFE